MRDEVRERGELSQLCAGAVAWRSQPCASALVASASTPVSAPAPCRRTHAPRLTRSIRAAARERGVEAEATEEEAEEADEEMMLDDEEEGSDEGGGGDGKEEL